MAVSGDIREGHQEQSSREEEEHEQVLDSHRIGSTSSDAESRRREGVPVHVSVTAGGSSSQIPAVLAAAKDKNGKRKGSGSGGSLGARRDRDLVARAAAAELSAAERRASERSGRASSRVLARVVRHDSRGLGASLSLFPPGAGKARRVQPATSGNDSNGDEERIATAALMERFSFRERELLHELQTWKSRCEHLKDNIIASGGDEAGRGQGSRGGGTGAHVHPRHAPPLNGRDTSDANVPGGSVVPSPSLRSLAKLHAEGVENVGPPTSRGGNVPIPGESRAETLDSGQRDVGTYSSDVDGREAEARRSAGGDVRWVLVLFDLPPERDGDLELRRQDVIEVSVGVYMTYEVRAKGGGGGRRIHLLHACVIWLSTTHSLRDGARGGG